MTTAALNIPPPAKVLRLPAPDAFAKSVILATADTYGTGVSRLLSQSILGRGRTSHIAIARQAAMWAMRCAGRSYPQIGLAFGRDHATAIHAFRKTERRNQRDPFTAARNKALLESCGIATAEGCPSFVGSVVSGRNGDFEDKRPGDLCRRPGCGMLRDRHEKEQNR